MIFILLLSRKDSDAGEADNLAVFDPDSGTHYLSEKEVATRQQQLTVLATLSHLVGLGRAPAKGYSVAQVLTAG